MPTHEPVELRRTFAQILEDEAGLTVRQLVSRLKRREIELPAALVSAELSEFPAAFRHDGSAPVRWYVDELWRHALPADPKALVALAFENWKSFGRAELGLGDITLLFGENSVGKSSLLQGVQMLRQTYGHGSFQFEGEYGSFGDLRNVVHGHVIGNPVRLSAVWQSQADEKWFNLRISSHPLGSAEGPDGGIAEIVVQEALNQDDAPGGTSLSLHLRPWLLRDPTGEFGEPNERGDVSAWAWDHAMPDDHDEMRLIFISDENGWPNPHDLVQEFTRGGSRFRVGMRQRGADDPVGVDEIDLDSTVTDGYEPAREAGRLLSQLTTPLTRALQGLGEILDALVHIGPYRSIPERWVQIDDVSPDHYLRRLMNPQLAEAANFWLDRFDIPFEISVESRMAPDARQSLRLVVQHVDGGERVQLQDIGFGIGQLLPIIVQLIANHGKTILIEEPEAHVHPRLQSALGDLFLESTQKRGNVIVAETHSEMLLLRLQRRVAEGAVRPGRLAVYNVTRESGAAELEDVEIGPNGQIGYQWPGGFFDNRMDDLVAILDPTGDR